MLNHNRYMTRRIAYELPEDLVIFMWMKIHELKAHSNGDMDYLQVFELKWDKDAVGQVSQLITHRSEQPTYEQRYELSVINAVETKYS